MSIHKVLVVDDSKTELMFMTDLLQKNGFTVKTAENAEDAFRRLAEEKPDLILMDIQLPEISGLDITRKIKADDEIKHIPVIAVTAFAMKDDEEKILAAGCEAYLSKPIAIDDFLATIRRYLEPALV